MKQARQFASVRQAIRHLVFIDQQLRATVCQDISDLRLLLAGAQHHADQTEIGGTVQRQHELVSVAEQQRDTVSRLQSDFLEASGNLHGSLRDFAPGHALVAADKRFAVGIAGGGLSDHGPDILGPLLKGGDDTIAETGFQPHCWNRILRPVHLVVSLSRSAGSG